VQWSPPLSSPNVVNDLHFWAEQAVVEAKMVAIVTGVVRSLSANIGFLIRFDVDGVLVLAKMNPSSKLLSEVMMSTPMRRILRIWRRQIIRIRLEMVFLLAERRTNPLAILDEWNIHIHRTGQ
jgi:hypothetical protein